MQRTKNGQHNTQGSLGDGFIKRPLRAIVPIVRVLCSFDELLGCWSDIGGAVGLHTLGHPRRIIATRDMNRIGADSSVPLVHQLAYGCTRLLFRATLCTRGCLTHRSS
ncbi:unnamed protein product [Ixodes pacificus]